jgi:hypothetical protein
MTFYVHKFSRTNHHKYFKILKFQVTSKQDPQCVPCVFVTKDEGGSLTSATTSPY